VVDVQNVGSTLSRKIRSELPLEEIHPQPSQSTSAASDPGSVSLHGESDQLSEGEIYIDEQGNLISNSE
jgi:hypothetical protein